MHFLFLTFVAGMSTSFGINWFYLTGSLSVFDIFVPFFLLILYIQAPHTKFKVDSILLVLLGLALIAGGSTVMSLLSSQTPASNPLYFVRSLFFVLVYLLILSWPVSRNHIVMGVFAGMLVSILIAIYVWTTAPRFFAFTSIPMMHVLDSPSGLRINRNQIGFCSSLAFLIPAYSFLYEDLMSRKKSLVFAFFLAIFTILTFSKGAWLILLIGTIGLVLLRYKAIKSALRLSALLSAGLLVFAVPNTLQNSIMERFANSGHTNDFRLEYIKNAIDIGAKFPVFGIGPGNYGVVSSKPEYATTIDPHNAYLQTFAEYGIFALLFVLLLYTVGFWQCFRHRKHDKLSNLILIVLFCLFIDGFVSGLSLSSKYLYIFLGLLVAGRSGRSAIEISSTAHRTLGNAKS
ncbi:O-antigen ligase family protein [Alphaproteobacteria bacterium]|nr:O-antigen ligase family protein [Alphaproteobacteria bacterium]MDA9581454.1 O-antigen ligase family protein [bacterium]MDA8624010.1 O-antigen ligase family protein [Alphaproteobacteria bacterium]MDA8642661.1 O-antigen ligase family protein [Alphaproteobacteria bacterium]MDA8666442.1 O-antigen ligase family protein [Alphaproteobacteria bacterium]